MSLHFLQPFINDTVDWKRLAYCVKHKYLPRRSGRTFARLAMMLREALVTRDLETSYIYVSATSRTSKMAYQDIYGICDFIGLKVALHESPFRIFIHDPYWPRPKARTNQFFFVAANDCKLPDLSRARCYGSNIMVIHDWDQWNGSGEVLQMLEAMSTKKAFSK